MKFLKLTNEYGEVFVDPLAIKALVTWLGKNLKKSTVMYLNYGEQVSVEDTPTEILQMLKTMEGYYVPEN